MSNVIDPYFGLSIDGYVITNKVGEGKIGSVYKIERNENDVFACKIIPEGKLKDGWEKELEKVQKLRSFPSVIEYKRHGSALDKNQRPFTYIFWNFVDGDNLKEYVKKNNVNLPFVVELAGVILQVLYACKQVGIFHGDLHDGNILISKPDTRFVDSKSSIYIADFGFGGSHNNKQPKDDFKQFHAIINNLLNKIDPANLPAEQRILHEKIKVFLSKKILEKDPTQAKFVGDLKSVIQEFNRLSIESENEAAKAKRGEDFKEPGDYLVAEALGYNVEEWRELFVPEFLAAKDLLSKNITVLTGARGCGKTMTFRRLTAYMDMVIGEPSGVVGADQFIGFYLNCRSIIEAFPFIPNKISITQAAQITHFYHLLWLAEICKTFSVYNIDQINGYDWLEEYLLSIFLDRYLALPRGGNVLANIRAFIENEKERTRLADAGKDYRPGRWELSRRDFLDEITLRSKINLSWANGKPFYFFLDDYTIPTIPRSLQLVLNPIIFKRRDNIFFKVSTESAISFERSLERNKPLELHQDFELIDLASESLHQDYENKKKLLENIFNRRIERDIYLKNNSLTLSDLLGKMPVSNNELARMMRDDPRKRRIYSGVEAFVGMWASDIRIMIQIFVDMLKAVNSQSNQLTKRIPDQIQNQIYRNAGSEFLDFTENVPDPSYLERQVTKEKNIKFGVHLKDIVEAFVNISRYELTQGHLIENEGRKNPKQAFRLEILDHFKIEGPAKNYYEGLIRWHIFLQDRRGKSVRGMLTPRLFLNRVLLPYAQLTFSTKEHIHVTNQELNFLLTEPQKFVTYWTNKRSKRQPTNQNKLL